MDQRALVQRAQRGDHDAFAMLAGQSIARLDAATGLILRDPELARDAVQEGFIGAWRNPPILREPDRFEAWLHRLVFRSCIDVLRRRGRRPIEVELDPIDVPAVADLSGIVADRELLDSALQCGADATRLLATRYAPCVGGVAWNARGDREHRSAHP